MKFSVDRNTLLKPLQLLIGAVERRQTMPILGNFLFRSVDGSLQITASDLELEFSSYVDLELEGNEAITLPGRKLLEICKALADDSVISFKAEDGKAIITSGRSRFTLSTLPANDFPLVDAIDELNEISLDAQVLRRVIEKTSFAMAQQDVRYYLNGLMLEVNKKQFRSVATDGHRLSLAEIDVLEEVEVPQVIVPRKGVQELSRLLAISEGNVQITFGRNHLQVTVGEYRLVTKLIDGKFPNYQRVIPIDHNQEARINCHLFKQSLARASILSNEKYRGVKLGLAKDKLTIQAHNPEQEEAEEELGIDYSGSEMEIGFNVGYLLDVINAIDSEDVVVYLKDTNSSMLLSSEGDSRTKYVVMPMRL